MRRFRWTYRAWLAEDYTGTNVVIVVRYKKRLFGKVRSEALLPFGTWYSFKPYDILNFTLWKPKTGGGGVREVVFS